MKACRSFAQGLVHEGKRGATGTGFSGGAQERAMPKPQPRQATCTLAVSIPSLLAHEGLARLKSSMRADGS